MRKVRVKTILFLVVSALLALLVIQAFQTAQLYDRKSSEFKERFKITLDRIAMRHEKAEDIRRYLAVANKDFGVKYRDILKEEFKTLLSAEESISIEDTSIFEGGEMQDYLIIKGKTYDSISGVLAEQRVLARDVRQLRDLFRRNDKDHVSRDSIQLAVQLDQRVIQQIFKKARFVNEIMIDAFRNNVYEDPSKRLDIAFLDSVLETELAFDHLPETFEFMITDEASDPIGFENAPANYVTNMDTVNSHSTLLFPSNTLDEDLYLHIHFPKQHSYVIKEMWGYLTVNFSLVILIVIALVFMFRTIITQKKLSEMKSDFISNMTHEFKTPISTISLACQAMNDTDMMGTLSEEAEPYIKMIDDENKRLSLLVERILQSATLEKGELKIRPEEFYLNDVISELVSNARFRITNSGGTITSEITDQMILINADRMHTTNMISNLIDNAIKYSEKSPEITVRLYMDGNTPVLSVEDRGIGIKKEHLNKIFDKLYRIPTGNVHNVKGFGLGLSYVKAIADLHGWKINVKSKYGSGSEFTIAFNN